MKKALFAMGCALALACTALLGGCALYGNDRSQTGLVYSEKTEQGVVFYLNEEQTLVYNRSGVSLDETTKNYKPYAGRVVFDGNTFPHYILSMDEEYARLEEKLFALDRKEQPLIQAYAVEAEEGTAIGFCNVYTSCTGFLSGGGQIDVDKIDRGVMFSYNKATDELKILGEVKRGCIVAFNQTHFICYENGTYYARETGGTARKLICKDEAYDNGMTHYSHACFYFTDGYCILKFARGYNNAKRDYEKFILCTMDGTVLGQIKLPRWR